MHQFIGQSTKKGKKTGSSSGQDTLAGMNQAQQQKVLQQFGEGVYNILVCTCVGEEGLDVSFGCRGFNLCHPCNLINFTDRGSRSYCEL